jgi:GPN-loop GTPase
MLQMEFPFINVLTKIDLLSQYGPLGTRSHAYLISAFKLDFYAQVQDLSYLLEHLNQSHRTKRYSMLTAAICELIDDFGLVSFECLAVEDKRSMARLLEAIDRAGGYMFGSTEASADHIWTSATRTGWASDNNVLDIQERWIDYKDEYDKQEREEWAKQAEEMQREAEKMEDIDT